MFSYQVADLAEFERYLLNWVEAFGAEVVPANGPSFGDVTDLVPAEVLAVNVDWFTLRFSTRTALTVKLFVAQHGGVSPEVLRYSFHFQTPGRTLWRFCRNDYHLADDGTPFHLHRADGTREGQPGPVTFRQVYEMVTLENAAYGRR